MTALLSVFLQPSETPPLRVTPPAIVTPPLDLTPPLSVARVRVTPLDRYRPHYVGIGSAVPGWRKFCQRPLERREVPSARAPRQDRCARRTQRFLFSAGSAPLSSAV